MQPAPVQADGRIEAHSTIPFRNARVDEEIQADVFFGPSRACKAGT